MSLLSIRMRAETLRSLGFASISGTYARIGTSLIHPARQILVQNLTDETVVFSFDGVNDHFVLPASGFFLSDITSNKSIAQGWFMAEGDALYVKEVGNPTTGSVYFSVFYGSE